MALESKAKRTHSPEDVAWFIGGLVCCVIIGLERVAEWPFWPVIRGMLIVVVVAGLVLAVNVQESWDWVWPKKLLAMVLPALLYGWGWYARSRRG
jgi:hypothetical protein